jgi:RNA polymerase sigma factor (sigma-70 family)
VTDGRPGRSAGVSALSTVAPMTPPDPPDPPSPVGFEELYRSTAGDLFAYVMTLVRDRGVAEEVTASAFERAFRKHDSWDARRGTQRQWLFGIARNAALDELRRHRRAATLEAEPGAAEAAGDEPVDSVQRATVRAALAGLSPRDRELVALKFFAGLDNAEIAGVLGISASNAGTRLHRAVLALREACHAPS